MFRVLCALRKGTVMERPFDDPHAGIESQVLNFSPRIKDSDEVKKARELGRSVPSLIALGKALSRQLRYREAIDAYSGALEIDPENMTAVRLRAGRYLSTIQSESAISDFERCLGSGADKLDCLYRIGLAHYYAGRHAEAMKMFSECMPLCDDEMGIAVIYWHTLSAARAGAETKLLERYHPGMAVGHHTGYEKAMRVWSGQIGFDDALQAAEKEPEDLEHSVVMYGLMYRPECTKKSRHLKSLLNRDGFWPCFSYLAAWNDCLLFGGSGGAGR